MKPPKVLDRIVDKVLSYKVPARSSKAKKRQRKRRKVQRDVPYRDMWAGGKGPSNDKSK